MKKKILFLITISLLVSCGVFKYKIAKIDEDGSLVGIIKSKKLSKEPYKVWFEKNYEGYNLDEKIVSKIKNNLKNIRVKVFLGTWCKDSKRQYPRFYKILEKADFNFDDLELIGVNKRKKAEGLEKGFRIYFVPTFIFYKKGKELGRIVEIPVETLEEDIFKIITEQPYKHAYEK